MRIQLNAQGKATLPSYCIKTSNINLQDIEELKGSALSGTNIFTFTQDQNMPILRILNDRGITFELAILTWHPKVDERLRTMSFTSEQETFKYLIVIEGLPIVDTIKSVEYKITLPPTAKDGQLTMRLKDLNSEMLAPIFGPYTTTGETGIINYKFLATGMYRMSVEYDVFGGSIDIAVGDLLEEFKVVKTKELDAKCNAMILQGFNSFCLGTEFTYDFDYEAQINFSGTLNGILSGMIEGPVYWKTREAGPLPHTIDQFKTLFKDGMNFKQTTIGKYWQLKMAVAACTNTDQITMIEW